MDPDDVKLTAQVFRDAAVLIRVGGLQKNTYERRAGSGLTSFCAIGALCAAAGIDHSNDLGGTKDVHVLCAELWERFGLPFDEASSDEDRVPDWNDREETTAEDVINALTKIAEGL